MFIVPVCLLLCLVTIRRKQTNEFILQQFNEKNFKVIAVTYVCIACDLKIIYFRIKIYKVTESKLCAHNR